MPSLNAVILAAEWFDHPNNIPVSPAVSVLPYFVLINSTILSLLFESLEISNGVLGEVVPIPT